MNNKYKKFLLMNIFSVLFVVGFVFMKPSYADSNTNLKSDNENSISSEKKLDNSDSISNENEASSDFDTISDENSDKIIEENKNLTSEETKSSSNLEENNDNIDNTNSKEVYEERSNLKSTYKKDGNFIWTSDGRRRYVYNDGSVPEVGFIEKDNYKYFTYGDGYIYTKQFITFGPSVMYYMDDYGRMSVGKFLDNSNRLRFSNDDGNLINSKGWKINKQGKHYAYNNGYLYTNQFITFGPSVMYYMDNYGRMSIGKFLDNSNNWRFSNDDGNLINSKGWKINKQGKHYAYGNGYLYTNQPITFGSKKMYFIGENGAITIGKFQDNNKKWRFSNDDGNLINSKGWKINKQGKHYAYGNGYLYTNQFITFGSKIMYFMGSDGLVKTSLFKHMNKIFNADSSGLILYGIQKIGNYYYHFTYNGISKGYKVFVNKHLYSFDNTGKGYLVSSNYTPKRDLDIAMGWMYQAMNFNYEYSMHWQKRNQVGYADCSSAVYRAMKHGGFISNNVANGNTETLFELGKRGQILKQISENEIRYGDIFVAGVPGRSAGAGGHTGFILDKNRIIHCNYADNGVSITKRKGRMGDTKYPVRYYRLVGAR